MKKLLFSSIALTIALSLAACGNEGEEISSEPTNEETGATSETADENESDNEEQAEEVSEESDNELLNVDLTDESIGEEEWIAAYNAQEELIDFEVEEIGYAWKEAETSGGQSVYSYYALVTNTGKGAIEIYPNAVTFYNQDGSVAAVSDDLGLRAYPDVINEGEKGLVRTYELTNDADLESFDYAEADVNVQLSIFDSTKLDTKSPTYSTDHRLSATASLENNTDVNAQGVTSAFVFYNDNGEFIGGLTTGLDDDVLQAGSKRGIETENPPFPRDQYENIADMEAWSYFMDYGDEWMD
ncbi:LptM family lipoprotein [Alkalicoccobacillus gibsonii]|uniref:LptM family lipoprotein n=1 Tax=Alkalicoccobacillus gibsonii TaxID=79881 RepID=UPI0019320D76|nr:hypothetical protein [Alkalicoccobacillus gibsonii]MBM0064797.1 hypothetical protein [Alkalicoccobacillus gibsonii]